MKECIRCSHKEDLIELDFKGSGEWICKECKERYCMVCGEGLTEYEQEHGLCKECI